jgi:predicted Zn-dependent protease
MTVAESQAAKPLRLKIVTVAPGDTVERLAARMTHVDHAAERFRILNGLGPREQVNPGDHVKLVVE